MKRNTLLGLFLATLMVFSVTCNNAYDPNTVVVSGSV